MVPAIVEGTLIKNPYHRLPNIEGPERTRRLRYPSREGRLLQASYYDGPVDLIDSAFMQ